MIQLVPKKAGPNKKLTFGSGIVSRFRTTIRTLGVNKPTSQELREAAEIDRNYMKHHVIIKKWRLLL